MKKFHFYFILTIQVFVLHTECFTVVIVFWGDWHTPKCGIPAIGQVSRLSCNEKQQNLQYSEVSEALRVDRLDKLLALQRMGSHIMRQFIKNGNPECQK